MRKNLFDIGSDIEEVVEDIIALEIENGEQLPDDHPLIQELTELHETRAEKHEAYVHVIKDKAAMAKSARAVAREFSDHAKACENLVTRLKDRLKADLIHYGEKSVDAGDFRVRRQNNPPALKLSVEPEALPREYQIISVEADNPAIKRALNNGAKIEGASLEIGEHVRIVARGRKR